MEVRGLLFDLDGTLVDSNAQHVEAWVSAFERHGFEVSPDAIAGQIGKGGDQLVPALLPAVDEKTAEALAEAHGTIFRDRHLAQIRPFADARALLLHAHARGHRLALASSASQPELEHYIELLGIGHVVEATTSADDVETSKPAGDIFAAAGAKLAPLTSAQLLVIGDTPYDIEAAARCGIDALAIRSGGFADERLAGAIAIYDDVAALLAGFDASPLSR